MLVVSMCNLMIVKINSIIRNLIFHKNLRSILNIPIKTYSKI